MGLKQEIDISDLANVTQQLTGIRVRASDLDPTAQNGIRLIMQQDVDYRFETAPPTETGGQVYGGVEWVSLSESYLAQNPRRYNGQILRDSGELLQTLTNEGSPYNISEFNGNSFVFGSNIAKAAPLQAKRPFVFWHAILLERVATFLVSYIGG